MKKYKVIALSVGGNGNQIFKSGDEVAENQFERGRADELVKKGFLKEEAKKQASEKSKKKSAPKKEEASKDTPPKEEAKKQASEKSKK